MENWIDYMATQVYVNNDEMAYNIRFFKSYEPEIKWRFILWDAGAGSEGETANSLQALLNFPYLSEEINLFDYMMDNTDFRNHFINRYADIMNYYYTPEIILGMIDENAAEIESEIEAQHDRWGTGNTATWTNGVDVLKGFYDNRNYYQRNEIESYFDMNDQVDITIEVNPPGAGYIKISTIIPEIFPGPVCILMVARLRFLRSQIRVIHFPIGVIIFLLMMKLPYHSPIIFLIIQHLLQILTGVL